MSILEHYDYRLPSERIAKEPADPRDSARLFFYDTKSDEIVFDTFAHLDRYLPKPSLLVFNNTKVVPARLYLTKETGGKIEVFLMMNELHASDTLIKGIVDRNIAPGAKLFFKNGDHLVVEKQEEQFFFFKPSVPIVELWKLIDAEGVTPIPPYIKGSTLTEGELRARYQSILAKYPASVAAPTASLHFTERLLDTLEQGGVSRTEVTLHVGAGTFAPIDEHNITAKKLFTELYDISSNSAETINRAKASGVPVIPVGSTALRTLESAARETEGNPMYPQHRVTLCSGNGTTDIFIYPPYNFRVADALITNFHVPKSSLMLLVDAFLQHKKAKRDIIALYDIAMQNDFRFYSFGDGMLIL